MSISIIGAGNMGKGLAGLFARAGYDVVIAARNPARAAEAANSAGAKTRAASVSEAAKASDIIVLAVPFGAVAETLAEAGDVDGKTIVDITNPLTADYSGLAIGHTTSAAEEIQKLAPKAKVIKAFNTIFASVLAAGGRVAGVPATVFIAGDDANANQAVAAIVARSGMTPLQAGGLKAARYLEPVAGLNIALGYGLGHGVDIAPAWVGAKAA